MKNYLIARLFKEKELSMKIINATFSLILLYCINDGCAWASDQSITSQESSLSASEIIPISIKYDQPYSITEAELVQKILTLTGLPKSDLTKEKIIQELGITSRGQTLNLTLATGLDWSIVAAADPIDKLKSQIVFDFNINPKSGLYLALEQNFQPSLQKQGWVFWGEFGGPARGVHGMNLNIPRGYRYIRNINGDSGFLVFYVNEGSSCISVIEESHCVYRIMFQQTISNFNLAHH